MLHNFPASKFENTFEKEGGGEKKKQQQQEGCQLHK